MKQKTLNLAVIIMLTIGLNFASAQSVFVYQTKGSLANTEHTDRANLVLDFYNATPGNFLVKTKTTGATLAPYAMADPFRAVTFDLIPDTNNPQPLVCLNTNSDFGSNNTDGWNIVGTTSFDASTGELVISATSAANWDILVINYYAFVPGKTYTVSFDASAPAPKDIELMIRHNFTPVAGLSTFRSITTNTQNHTYQFTYSGGDTQTRELIIACGGGSGITLDNICISDEATLSTNEIVGSNNTFKIYPNPVKDELSLNLPEAGNLNIYSLDGKLVMSKKITTVGSSTLNVANLTTGIYVCRYTNSKETKTVKLAKL